MSSDSQFIGYSRKKTTRWSVKLGDIFSKYLITVGGIGTIVSVSTVFLFLLWVSAPLLKTATIQSAASYTLSHDPQEMLHIVVDEYKALGTALYRDGTVTVFDYASGRELMRSSFFTNKIITAHSVSPGHPDIILGFEDGSVVVGEISFQTSFMDDDGSAGYAKLDVGERMPATNGVIERISSSQLRLLGSDVNFDEPITMDITEPVHAVDVNATAKRLMYVVCYTNGETSLVKVRKRKNLLTGKITYDKETMALPTSSIEEHGLPGFLGMVGLGDSVIMTWSDGHIVRISTSASDKPYVAEQLNITPDGKETLTAASFLLGKTTLLTGESDGYVKASFPAFAENSQAGDEKALITGHVFRPHDSAVTRLTSSARMRMIAVGYDDGTVALRHVTSEKKLGTVKANGAVLHLAIAPRDDGLLAVTEKGIHIWDMDPHHPETTLKSLFGKIWYEGAPKPEYVWQSSSGTDDFEPKLSLMPLIFGTIKATIFSLMFGVPIALLAAIYTSEFMNPKWKSRIKPFVEMMASLPSVVLGFLAALVFAPIVAKYLPQFLSLGFTIPLSFLGGAYLWQLLPHKTAMRMRHYRLPLMFLALPVGFALTSLAGPLLEQVCFAGDSIRWLDGQIGHAAGGWFLLLWPLIACMTAYVVSLTVNPWLRRVTSKWDRTACALADLAKATGILLVILVVGWGVSMALETAGLDPRTHFFGTYEQRNALVVGFVMGFAVIPIIYTIAEDALSAVPEHLRSASLGTGATPWQTATRIIIPTAMSGLFSAVMIGLGRAVGETMIVLMAAGNTPVMEWNIFNGFRTLSANIAVELPEAVRNSTHYRTLFLAALTLFVMTFILNTFAELVRMRFRKKAISL